MKLRDSNFLPINDVYFLDVQAISVNMFLVPIPHIRATFIEKVTLSRYNSKIKGVKQNLMTIFYALSESVKPRFDGIPRTLKHGRNIVVENKLHTTSRSARGLLCRTGASGSFSKHILNNHLVSKRNQILKPNVTKVIKSKTIYLRVFNKF